MFQKLLSIFKIRKRQKSNTQNNVLDVEFNVQSCLSLKLRKALKDANITTIRDILSVRPQQILISLNMDLSSFSQLINFLERHQIIIENVQGKETFVQDLPSTHVQQIPQSVLNLRFEEQLELSAKIISSLKSENIENIADIMPYTKQQLTLLPNIGTTSLNSLYKFLDKYGITIGKPYKAITSNIQSNNDSTKGSVRDFILNNCDQRTAAIIIAKYEGKSTKELADLYHLSYQRIMQICAKINWKRINQRFQEDALQDFFQKYAWDRDTFCCLTKEPQLTYGYLHSRYKKGKTSPIELFPENEPISNLGELGHHISETPTEVFYRKNLKFEKFLIKGIEYIQITRYKKTNPITQQENLVLQKPGDLTSIDVATNKQAVEDVLSTLSEREATVIRLLFGIDSGHPHTLEEVGKMYNITRERVRQIKAKAIRKLRHPSHIKMLENYDFPQNLKN